MWNHNQFFFELVSDEIFSLVFLFLLLPVFFEDEVGVRNIVLTCICDARGFKNLLEPTLLNFSLYLVIVLKIFFAFPGYFKHIFFVYLVAN